MPLRQFDGGETYRRQVIVPCREQKRKARVGNQGKAHHAGKVRLATLVRDDAHDVERFCHRTTSWMDLSDTSELDRWSRRADDACSRAFEGCSSSSGEEWMDRSSVLGSDGINCVRCFYSWMIPNERGWKSNMGNGLRPRCAGGTVSNGTRGSASVPRRKLHVVNQTHAAKISCHSNQGMGLAHLLDWFQCRSIHHFDVIHPAAVVFDGLSYA